VPEEEKIDVLVEVLRLPRPSPSARYYRRIEAVSQESKEPSPGFTSTEVPVLTEKVHDGKKALVLIEIFKMPVSDNVETGARKERSADDITSAGRGESTPNSSISATTEIPDKVTEEDEDRSGKPSGQKASSGMKREARGSETRNHNINEDDNEEDDMSVAETIIFRPLFSYRQDSAARRRSFRDVSRTRSEYDYY
jgi:hypothetical protein